MEQTHLEKAIWAIVEKDGVEDIGHETVQTIARFIESRDEELVKKIEEIRDKQTLYVSFKGHLSEEGFFVNREVLDDIIKLIKG